MDEIGYIRSRVRELMTARGVNTSETARGSGVNQSFLSRLVGKKPKRPVRRISHENVSRLERYFGEPITRPMGEPLPGLSSFLKEHASELAITTDEAAAMRRVGVPPGGSDTRIYWTAILVALRTR